MTDNSIFFPSRPGRMNGAVFTKIKILLMPGSMEINISMMLYDILQKECFRDVQLFYMWLIWSKVADYKRRHKHFVLFVIVSEAIFQ